MCKADKYRGTSTSAAVQEIRPICENLLCELCNLPAKTRTFPSAMGRLCLDTWRQLSVNLGSKKDDDLETVPQQLEQDWMTQSQLTTSLLLQASWKRCRLSISADPPPNLSRRYGLPLGQQSCQNPGWSPSGEQ